MYIGDDENLRTDVNDLTNIGVRKSQISKNEIQIQIFNSRPQYIINALQKKDESFYLRGKRDTNFKSSNLKDYPIFKYSTCCFKYINTYLRTEKMYEYDKKYDWFRPRTFTLDEIHSWIWCLHKELCSRPSNVPNGTLTYRGIRNVRLPSSFKVGTTFAFAEFLSTSTNINISKKFLKDSRTTDNDSKIIFYITILNTRNAKL